MNYREAIEMKDGLKEIEIATRAKQIRSLQRLDKENAHYMADEILCEMLTELGYGDVVKEFEKLEKWYA